MGDPMVRGRWHLLVLEALKELQHTLLERFTTFSLQEIRTNGVADIITGRCSPPLEDLVEGAGMIPISSPYRNRRVVLIGGTASGTRKWFRRRLVCRSN